MKTDSTFFNGWQIVGSLIEEHGIKDYGGRKIIRTIVECITDVAKNYWDEVDMFQRSYSISERDASETYIRELNNALLTWVDL